MRKSKIGVEDQYLNLLEDILNDGEQKGDRTGTGTYSLFGERLVHDMSDGFPLLTTKKMGIKTIIKELLWFLRGETNIRPLVIANCNIWNGDAYKYYVKNFEVDTVIINGEYYRLIEQKGDGLLIIDHKLGITNVVLESSTSGTINEPLSMEGFVNMIIYCEWFAEKWGELGPIYGSQWRKWDGGYDQIQTLIHDLKNNPDSRRLMVTAWNPSDLDSAVLPPCHYGFQCYTNVMTYKERYDWWFTNNYETGMEKNYNIVPDFDNEYYKSTPKRKLSLMWNQRSCDFPLGIPFNIASYGLLLIILAKQVNMVPHMLKANLGDCHIYLNQIDGVREQLMRVSKDLPRIVVNNKFNFADSDINKVYHELLPNDFTITSYNPEPPINFPLSN